MVTVNPRFNVETGTEFSFGVGVYVRKRGEDWGTGQVVARSRAEVLNEDNVVVEQIVYSVNWLDQKNSAGEMGSVRPACQTDLESSARGVPKKFASPEEAEAWMEQQMETGNWTAKAQDSADSAGDVDVELRKILEAGE